MPAVLSRNQAIKLGHSWDKRKRRRTYRREARVLEKNSAEAKAAGGSGKFTANLARMMRAHARYHGR